MERRLERLRGLEETESPFRMNQMELLQDQAIMLNERCRKYKNEIDSLKDKVALLGKVGKLIGDMTLLVWYPDYREDKKLHLISLRDCVEKVEAASKMMTLLMPHSA